MAFPLRPWMPSLPSQSSIRSGWYTKHTPNSDLVALDAAENEQHSEHVCEWTATPIGVETSGSAAIQHTDMTNHSVSHYRGNSTQMASIEQSPIGMRSVLHDDDMDGEDTHAMEGSSQMNDDDQMDRDDEVNDDDQIDPNSDLDDGQERDEDEFELQDPYMQIGSRTGNNGIPYHVNDEYLYQNDMDLLTPIHSQTNRGHGSRFENDGAYLDNTPGVYEDHALVNQGSDASDGEYHYQVAEFEGDLVDE
ncbi:hypothetical protein BSLG_009541 [Batrachochytrium salamandrivorans]|nr:hypothetical protein BASA62_002851 [Batrachochytrium salamandrivorans]KAJ1330407.1 hypothetical protein BSLG_009541 [Batrachochytrium salamandrivorans]